jgi:alanine dehydrogenase
MHFAVSLNVMLGGMLGVFGGVDGVTMSQVSVVGGGFVVAVQMLLCGFVVMARSVLVVFRCLGVMVCCFF